MDMRMPELDGHDVQRLKSNPALQHIPVIAVTACPSGEGGEGAADDGDGFIRKALQSRRAGPGAAAVP